jgi:hypothetical protein
MQVSAITPKAAVQHPSKSMLTGDVPKVWTSPSVCTRTHMVTAPNVLGTVKQIHGTALPARCASNGNQQNHRRHARSVKACVKDPVLNSWNGTREMALLLL